MERATKKQDILIKAHYRGLLLNGNSHLGIALYALENKKSKSALETTGIFYRENEKCGESDRLVN